MKKLLLGLLTLGCFVSAEAQLVHSARDVIINVITRAKGLVIAHPYLTVAAGCTAVVAYWFYYKKQIDPEDPSFEGFKAYWDSKNYGTPTPKTVSPSDSPTHSSDTLKDFTGDFPDTQSKTMHPSKLRHN
jgi:hypothetical protein